LPDALLRPRRLLVRVSLALVLYWVVAFLVAMTQDWPAELSTDAGDDPESVGEWIVRGSLLAPPLAPFLAQLVLTFAAARSGVRWVLSGAVGLVLLGIVYVLATLGEPLDPERSDPPTLVYLAFRVVGLSLLAALIALALWTAVRAVRALRR
jgi:hypothetical protein